MVAVVLGRDTRRGVTVGSRLGRRTVVIWDLVRRGVMRMRLREVGMKMRWRERCFDGSGIYFGVEMALRGR